MTLSTTCRFLIFLHFGAAQKNRINTSYATKTTVGESTDNIILDPEQEDGRRLWLTWGPTTPGGPGGPVLPWNPWNEKEKKNRAVIQMTLDSTDEELSAQSSFYSQSLLSVQDVQAVRLFLQVPEKNIQNTNEVHRKALWVGRVSLQTKIN